MLRTWCLRGLLLLGLVVLSATAAGMVARHMRPGETGPRLTHSVKRGDLRVTVTERGTLESSENAEIKCEVRGQSIVIWVVESGTTVQPGDELVRLDSLFIEEQIDERSKYAHWSRSAAESSKARVARAELQFAEYEQGQYITQRMRLERDLAVAKSRLRSTESKLAYETTMARSDYASALDVEEQHFALDQAKRHLEVTETAIDLLERFTKAERLETLRGDLASVKATHEANVERAMADASRRDRALEEYTHCVVRAERGGLVIHPNAAQWDNAPEIAEGVSVHKDQVMLLMPDVTKMRVKIGALESDVERIHEGLTAKVVLPNRTLNGVVASVSVVAQPAGWWAGDEVRYDTFVDLPEEPGLRPGMSAEAEILIAEYHDVLSIPVAAIIETETENLCWVKTAQGPVRRELTLGDSNDRFTVVEAGLKEGEEVLLNPMALPDAKAAVETTTTDESDRPTASETSSPGQSPASGSKPPKKRTKDK